MSSPSSPPTIIRATLEGGTLEIVIPAGPVLTDKAGPADLEGPWHDMAIGDVPVRMRFHRRAPPPPDKGKSKPRKRSTDTDVMDGAGAVIDLHSRMVRPPCQRPRYWIAPGSPNQIAPRVTQPDRVGVGQPDPDRPPPR